MEQGETSPRSSRSKREVTRERILDAAEELYSTRNPAQVTVRQVAEKAGVTHALVHQYVGTKEDLLNAVIHRAAPRRQETIADLPDFRAVLPLLAADVFKRKVHSRTQVRSAMDGVEYTSLTEPIATGRMLVELGNRALAEGAVRLPHDDPIDVRIAMAGFVAMTYGWAAMDDWLPHLFDLQDEDPEDVRQQLIELLSCLIELVFPVDTPPCPANDTETLGDIG